MAANRLFAGTETRNAMTNTELENPKRVHKNQKG